MSKNETIVDRVVLRLKTQPLGDLITEEDLHDIVKEAIPKTFFEKQVTRQWDGYRDNQITKDPIIVEIMRDLLKDKAKELVAAWLIDHRAEVLTYWKTVMDATLKGYVEAMQSEQINQHIRTMLSPMLTDINNERMKHGLPMLGI